MLATARSAREFIHKNFRKIFDDYVIPRLDYEYLESRAQITGLEHLDDALKFGKGAIVISAHFHANRLAEYFLRRRGYPMMSIRNRRPLGAAASAFRRKFISKTYGVMLDSVVEDEATVQDYDALGANILRRLRENGIVNVHIDAAIARDWVQVKFLDVERPFATGFVKFAELTGAPLIPMQCFGDSAGFKVIFGEAIAYKRSANPQEFRDRLHFLAAKLESWVVASPSEWELWRVRPQ